MSGVDRRGDRDAGSGVDRRADPDAGSATPPRQVAIGRWLFQRRSFTPLPLIVAVLLYLALERPAAGPGDPRLELALSLLSLLLLLAGIALRLAVIGRAPPGTSGRGKRLEARELVTWGAYAWTRNPLYLGNLLMCLGLSLETRSLAVTAGVLAFFYLQYAPVIRAEEAFLRARFGAQYEAWAVRVPAFWPRPSRRSPAERSDTAAGCPDITAAGLDTAAGRPDITAAGLDTAAGCPDIAAGRSHTAAGCPDITAAGLDTAAGCPDIAAGRSHTAAAGLDTADRTSGAAGPPFRLAHAIAADADTWFAGLGGWLVWRALVGRPPLPEAANAAALAVAALAYGLIKLTRRLRGAPR